MDREREEERFCSIARGLLSWLHFVLKTYKIGANIIYITSKGTSFLFVMMLLCSRIPLSATAGMQQRTAAFAFTSHLGAFSSFSTQTSSSVRGNSKRRRLPSKNRKRSSPPKTKRHLMWPIPFSTDTSPEELDTWRKEVPFYALRGELGRRYNVDTVFNHQEVKYLGSAGGIDECTDLNPYAVPEVCFVGRSNCGKSKLVNALLGRKNIAKVSSVPGKTQRMQLFGLSIWRGHKGAVRNPKLALVDLPGYGFAKVKATLAEEMGVTVSDYILNRSLRVSKRVFVLLDARRGVTDIDSSMIAWLETATSMPYQIVLTKCDLLEREELEQQVASVSNHMQTVIEGSLKEKSLCAPQILGCSSKKKLGLQHVRKAIVHACFSDRVDANAKLAKGGYSSVFWRKWASGTLKMR